MLSLKYHIFDTFIPFGLFLCLYKSKVNHYIMNNLFFLKKKMTSYSTLHAILVLEDDTVYHGKAAGKIGTTTDEICFNTGTTGYQEIFTDPSYFGQIMVTTNAHIGNYGVDEDDTE